MGVFRPCAGGDRSPRIGTRVGDVVIDLRCLSRSGLLPELLQEPSLGPFLEAGRDVWREVRATLQQRLLADGSPRSLKHSHAVLSEATLPAADVEMLLPVDVGGFTDFYASPHHARWQQLPNWHHMPLAYNSRASSVVVSGTPVRRPRGQHIRGGEPAFGPSQALDLELEMGAVVGGPANSLGERIPLEAAADRIYGLVLLNDWSARDIQGWEMNPLGPFLGKAFCTSISPWIVPLDALAPFRCDNPPQDPEPLAYLRHDGGVPSLDIRLRAEVLPPGGARPRHTCLSNFRHVYWSLAQFVAHHSSGGCPLRAGDLLGTGTISGPGPEARGCLAELARAGGRVRYLSDGETVSLRAWCGDEEAPLVDFGECVGTVRPARAEGRAD